MRTAVRLQLTDSLDPGASTGGRKRACFEGVLDPTQLFLIHLKEQLRKPLLGFSRRTKTDVGEAWNSTSGPPVF